ncbi:MAG: glycosyltransferase [Bacteroidales bacterium]|nr:glycosyltransferase [Bacteroidales bacterium]
MFSVVIPLYNKAPYIGKAIKSVLGQQFNAFELIIVDDGSTDGGTEVVEKFIDLRIHLIRQDNAGVSTARNNGVKAAKYDYIAFLDADDWWDENYLQSMFSLIKKYPDAALWAAKYYKVKHGRNIEANIGLDKGFKDGYIDYFKVYARTMWMPITSSSFIIRKDSFEQVGGFNHILKFGEDFYLWLHIALKYKMAYLNKPLVYYNQDVDVQQRAVGGQRLWEPRHHYIFNLDGLKAAETALKTLLDKMRLNALLRYRLSRAYPEDYRKELNKIDFDSQPLHWKLKYQAPLWMVRSWFALKKLGSAAKTKLIKIKPSE